DAVRHLFRVASSLDSLVVGETEILGQVQSAYEQARQAGVTDKVLGTLFQRAIRTGKETREKTRIGNGKVSIASVAVDLAETVLRDIAGKTAMVIGSGTMSEAALSRLMERGIGQVIVLNRTFERARELASRFRGEAGPLDVLRNHLHRADIIISSTGAPEPILGVDAFQDAMARRRGAPILLIDIAVPRDVDPAVGALENVFYYDIDSLENQARLNQQQRARAITEAERLVEEAVKGFGAWRRGLTAEPMVLALTRYFESARERELCRLRGKLAAMPPEQREIVEQLAQRLVATLLHRPLEVLKTAAAEGDPEALLDAVERLFNLRRDEMVSEDRGEGGNDPAC
ncbi:MAG TPA: glutamyl-tRNA reductase, partial [Candidatus Hydrogenedentes bacterium]|nr:glutamyl-tRNA reductase [Candidatus Hydrogenedentota bacterium]